MFVFNKPKSYTLCTKEQFLNTESTLSGGLLFSYGTSFPITNHPLNDFLLELLMIFVPWKSYRVRTN